MSPWFIRLGTILFVVMLYKAAPMLAVVLVVAAIVVAIGMLLVKGDRLPGAVMSGLRHLSDEPAAPKRTAAPSMIDAAALSNHLKPRVIGQDATIDAIAWQLRRRLAATRPDHPLAVFCFAGATGTGKTYLAKALVEELYRDTSHLHFFDMSQYGQPFAASSLFGSPRGYVGSQQYGALTAALRDVPECVVLLDEFEKAHPDVHKRFLAAWNDGFVTEMSDGAKIACNRAIFILTTNAAQSSINDIAARFYGEPELLDPLVKSALLDAQFTPELLSRIDEVFVFRELKGLDLARVVALEIERAAARYGLDIADKGIAVEVLLDATNELSHRNMGGARDIARTIERQITDGLIDARGQGAKVIWLTKDGGTIRVMTRMPPNGAEAANAARLMN